LKIKIKDLKNIKNDFSEYPELCLLHPNLILSKGPTLTSPFLSWLLIHFILLVVENQQEKQETISILNSDQK